MAPLPRLASTQGPRSEVAAHSSCWGGQRWQGWKAHRHSGHHLCLQPAWQVCQAGGGWKGWDWGLSPLAQVPSFQEEALRPRVLLCLQCVPLYVLSHHLCITLRNWCPHFWKNTLRGLRRSSHLSQVTRVSGGSDGIRHGSVWLRSSCFPPCVLYLKRVGALAELTLFSLL